jgi:hypothetical protein
MRIVIENFQNAVSVIITIIIIITAKHSYTNRYGSTLIRIKIGNF